MELILTCLGSSADVDLVILGLDNRSRAIFCRRNLCDRAFGSEGQQQR
jgi:hypothetical protein